MKKYELTDETKIVGAHFLHRIRALRSFGDVREGELGGWIENEENLSHGGDCWVYHEACVYDNARVTENAWVYGSAKVYGNAQVFGGSRVYGNARVFGGAWVCGNALVCENARVSGNSRVYRLSCLSGDTILKISEYIWFSDIKLDHGTWEDVIKINDKKYLVSNMLDLYEVPG